VSLNKFTAILEDDVATVAMGNTLAQLMEPGLVLYLHGDLGAGKTTFSRGVIQGLGHKGNVKSPTYTLVEPYESTTIPAYHFDLYRLADPEELEFMGIRDYFNANTLCLIEWPERGQGILPTADIDIEIQYLETKRKIEMTANTELGSSIILKLS
jgi:tRNA threonylcarbamoyladenosine biosynthesis protein TsaE